MSKIYIVWCMVMLSSFAYASHNGFAYSSLLSGEGMVNKTANHYHK